MTRKLEITLSPLKNTEVKTLSGALSSFKVYTQQGSMAQVPLYAKDNLLIIFPEPEDVALPLHNHLYTSEAFVTYKVWKCSRIWSP